jgi:V8-like Glu-specific endopeptidase
MKYLIFLSLLFASCGGNNVLETEPTASGVIIGEDGRRPLESGNRLGMGVGKILLDGSDGKTYECSATLIAHDYIISASHCFIGPDNVVFDSGRFYPDVDGLNSIKHIYDIEKVFISSKYIGAVLSGDAGPGQLTLEATANDIAIAKLKIGKGQKSAGSVYGFKGYWGRNNHEGYVRDGLTVGYPGDKASFHRFHQFCSFYNLGENSHNNLYGSSCDIVKGQSGSPVFFKHEETGAYNLRGIVSGEGVDENYVALIDIPTHLEMSKIISGDQTKLVQFTDFIMDVKPVGMFRVVNKCKESVYVATYARRALNEGFSTKAYYEIKAGESVIINSLVDERFGYYIQNYDGSSVYSGPEYRAASHRDMKGNFIAVVMKQFPGIHSEAVYCN